MCGAFSGFFGFYMQLSFRSFVQKTAFLLVGIPFGSSYGFVLGETQILANLRSSWDSRHVGFLYCSFTFPASVHAASVSVLLPTRFYAGPRFFIV